MEWCISIPVKSISVPGCKTPHCGKFEGGWILMCTVTCSFNMINPLTEGQSRGLACWCVFGCRSEHSQGKFLLQEDEEDEEWEFLSDLITSSHWNPLISHLMRRALHHLEPCSSGHAEGVMCVCVREWVWGCCTDSCTLSTSSCSTDQFKSSLQLWIIHSAVECADSRGNEEAFVSSG